MIGNRARLAESLRRLQVTRQVLTKTRSTGHAIDLALLLYHRKLDRGASCEMIENLLGPPAPGMMLAHERASSIDRALLLLDFDTGFGPGTPLAKQISLDGDRLGFLIDKLRLAP